MQSKIKQNCQYQAKSVKEWAAQFKYLKFDLKKFDFDLALAKGTMICFF